MYFIFYMIYFLIYLWLTHEYWIPARFLWENYEASTHGNIRKYWKEMCQVETQYWYLKIKIQINKKRKIYQTHRVICEVFYWKNDLHVNHIDGNKKNNWPCNIEYCTRSENQRHAVQLGLIPSWYEDPRSKIVIQKTFQWVIIWRYSNTREAGTTTWVLRWNIRNCCVGKVRSAGGFYWEFE